MNYDRVNKFMFCGNIIDMKQYEEQNFTLAEEKHFYKFVDPTDIKEMDGRMRIRSKKEYAIVKKLWEYKNIHIYYRTYNLWSIIKQFKCCCDFWEKSFVVALYNRYCDLVYYERQDDYMLSSTNTYLYSHFDLIIDVWDTKPIIREAWCSNIEYLINMLYNFRHIPTAFTTQANQIIAYLISAHDKDLVSSVCKNYLSTAFRTTGNHMPDIPYEFVKCEESIYRKINGYCEFCAFIKFYLKYWDDETAIKYLKKCENKKIKEYLTTKQIYDYLLINIDFNDNLKTFIKTQYILDAFH